MTGRSDLSRSEGKSEGLSESGKTSDTLDVEEVLAEHTAAGFFYTPDGHAECYCGHVLGAGETYPAHVAAFLRRQIGEVLAEVWDEALIAVANEHGNFALRVANPYRAVLVAPSRVPGEES